MQLSVIIVNYNVKYFLELCLNSVLKACKPIQAEIIVVDNFSSDGSKEYLEQKFPSVIFKWNTQNVGFAKANNSVLSEAKGEYILFLNPDTIVPENCFTKCLHFFATHATCGAMGLQMIDAHGRFLKESKRSFPSASASLFKLTGLAWLFPSSKIFAKYYAGNLPADTTNKVDALAGAFMMLSKDAINKINGFDETFFMYGEDIDLSYRIKQAGFDNYYFADTSIIHFKGESTQKQSASYVTHFYGAMKLFVQKHYANKKMLSFFILQAIAFSSIMARIKHRIIYYFKKGNNTSDTGSLAVVGTDEEFNRALSIIKFAQPAVTIAGRITPIDISNDKLAPSMQNALMLIKKNKINKVVFCEDVLSFEAIIQLLRFFPKNISYLFFAKNSQTIIGSGDAGGKAIIYSKA